MAHPMGAGSEDDLRLDFDPRVRLEFHGSKLSSDGGLLLYRELDEALGLFDKTVRFVRDTRKGKNGVHTLMGLLRQSVFGRLASYEDLSNCRAAVNDGLLTVHIGTGFRRQEHGSTSNLVRLANALHRGVRHAAFRLSGFSQRARAKSVLIRPGAMQLTRTL